MPVLSYPSLKRGLGYAGVGNTTGGDSLMDISALPDDPDGHLVALFARNDS
jgi:hypothetical protein